MSGIVGYIRIIAMFVILDLQTEMPIKCASIYYMYTIYNRTELYLSRYSGASLTVMGPKAKEKFHTATHLSRNFSKLYQHTYFAWGIDVHGDRIAPASKFARPLCFCY